LHLSSIESFNIKNRLSVLGFCSGLGQRKIGLELAPSCLHKGGLRSLLEISRTVELWTELHPDPQANNDDSWTSLQQLYEEACRVLDQGHQLLTIGGDHSLAIATIQAALNRDPNTRIVWVDAHGDINTPATSVTGNLHGMPLAALLGLFETPIKGVRLKPENLIMVGVRDLDPPEVKILTSLKINIISSKEALINPDLCLEVVKDWLKVAESIPIHLSFDIDGLDPVIAPATTLQVPRGLTLEFAKRLCKMLGKTQNMISMDFVEMNPLMAKSEIELAQTIDVAKEIIAAAFSSPPKVR
jgi:arginase